MDNQLKAFTISGIILAILLLMYQLPTLHIGDTTLRKVAILSDLLPEPDTTELITPLPKPVPLPVATDNKTKDFNEYRPEGTVMIEDYSQDKAGGMNHFYQMLAKASTLPRPVRIAYFGDSFIEADILTADIREMLQEKYGGKGIGWIDCTKGTNGSRPTIAVVSKGFTESSVTKHPYVASNLDINQKYFKAVTGASLKCTATTFRKGTSTWQNSMFFYEDKQGTTQISGSVNNQPLQPLQPTGSGLQMVSISQQAHAATFEVTQAGAGSLFFGAAFESDRGVIVDNLGMRGISGYALGTLSDERLAAFAHLRPYDLIILHYGLNVATDDNDTQFVKHYLTKMKAVVAKLRKAYPEAAILIMSVTDRDQRTADGIRTMKVIPVLISYQQQLAAQEQVAFYSMFEAMGGKNSVRRYVDKKWANKDYTHINYEGGKQLARQFCKSVEAGMENYRRKQQAGIIK